jgi:DNA-binding YbaB/EbfC family protein
VFKGLGGLGDLASLFKQAQEMGGKVEAIREQLKFERITGAAGGGMVEVEVNGLCEVLRLSIDPGLIERGEREMIEDLVPAAMNQAASKAKERHSELMKSMTGGLNIPGIDGAIEKLLGGGP